MNTRNLWKHTWPSSKLLCEFILENANMWLGATTLELGAGVAALPTLTALKCGAYESWITEQTDLHEAFDYLQQNLAQNLDANVQGRVHITDLNWNDDRTVDAFIEGAKRVDFVFGSDVFFDPQVFGALIHALRRIFDAFPHAEFYFVYQIRDSDWSIEDLLVLNRLSCSHIRTIDTDHSFHLAKIVAKLPSTDSSTTTRMVFAGIEGGATHSILVFVTSDGQQLGEFKGSGLNFLLDDAENTIEQIASWVRSSAQSLIAHGVDVHLPVDVLGLGLSGAENKLANHKFLTCLLQRHGDLAKRFSLTSDSVIAALSAFEHGGVVLISGTGSACRFVKENGEYYGAGGWGHMVSDGGSAFWVSMRVIRIIFEIEDGMTTVESDHSAVKAALLAHFKVNETTFLLNHLYGQRFQKSAVAAFAAKLSELAEQGDIFALQMFADAGSILAQHLCAVSRHFDLDMFADVPVLIIGSMFKSWKFMRKGFSDAILKHNESAASAKFKRISLLYSERTAAAGAIIFALTESRPADSSEVNLTNLFAGLRHKVPFDQLVLY